MADSTLAKLTTALQDEIGDSSTGFFTVDTQSRAINKAREYIWGYNFIPTMKESTFNVQALVDTYNLAGIAPDYRTHYYLRYKSSAASEAFQLDWVSTRLFVDGQAPTGVFTVMPVAGLPSILVQPKPYAAVTNGYTLVYFPHATEMAGTNPNYEDPLINWYPQMAECVVWYACARLRRQEGAADEAIGYMAKFQDCFTRMLQSVDHRVVTRHNAIEFQADY